jgi:adenosylmethionine-8-amino-7-oxononanoate aminotransferase
MTTSAVRETTARPAGDIEELDRRHLIHPHQTRMRADRRVIVRGKGSTVWDSHGRARLDVTGAGNWVAQVGHGREELAEAAAEQIRELAYFTCFYEFSNDKAVQLAARLADLAPTGVNRVYFTGSGSEGNDTAIKAARLFHHRNGEPDRTWILGRQFGYHGASYGSGTVTGFDLMHQGVGPNLPHVERLSPAWPYHQEFYQGQDPTDFLVAELEQTIERIGAGNIAAMIGEPILGGGGVVAPPEDYWPRIRQVLRANGILLIADEVITAYGRTGAWFDSTGRGMDPDIIVTAKGLTSGYAPLGAVLLSDRIASVVADTDDFFFHGHTYSGHPSACAIALRNLRLLEDENLLARSRQIGDWFRDGLAKAAELPAVGEVRVEGATVGIELVADRATRVPQSPFAAVAACDELYDRHDLILRHYGPTIVMAPPLVITEAEVARAADGVTEVLSRLGTDGVISGL